MLGCCSTFWMVASQPWLAVTRSLAFILNAASSQVGAVSGLVPVSTEFPAQVLCGWGSYMAAPFAHTPVNRREPSQHQSPPAFMA